MQIENILSNYSKATNDYIFSIAGGTDSKETNGVTFETLFFRNMFCCCIMFAATIFISISI